MDNGGETYLPYLYEIGRCLVAIPASKLGDIFLNQDTGVWNWFSSEV